MVFQKPEGGAQSVGEHLLNLTHFGQQVNEHVRNRDAPGYRQPDAARGTLQKAQFACKKVGEGEPERGEQRHDLKGHAGFARRHYARSY